jgi:predicted MPP superfamily phosphohydrolase
MSLTRIAIFLSIVTTVSSSIHYYLWARLVRDVGWPAGVHRGLTILLISLAVLLPLSFVLMRVFPVARSVQSPIMWVLYSWMGLMFCLFVLLIPADLVRFVAWLIERVGGDPVDPARRLFLSRLFGGVVGLGGLAMAGWGVVAATRRPVAVKPVEVAVAGLPPAFAGFRIVQLTDVHVGPTIGREFIDHLVERTNALEPDIVAITGDLVDGSVAALGAFLEPLQGLQARHGVFFVTGNHEYFSGADEWIAHLRALGVTVLRNERVTLTKDGQAIDLAGVDDPTGRSFAAGHGADLARALAGRDPSRPVILLAHQPKAAIEAADHGVALQLSGHTHGGQIFPFNYLVKLQQPFVAGLHRLKDTAIYVSPGTGYWGPPMRVGAPAEITDITLRVA